MPHCQFVTEYRISVINHCQFDSDYRISVFSSSFGPEQSADYRVGDTIGKICI